MQAASEGIKAAFQVQKGHLFCSKKHSETGGYNWGYLIFHIEKMPISCGMHWYFRIPPFRQDKTPSDLSLGVFVFGLSEDIATPSLTRLVEPP